ncbi:MAG: LemA family protein [Candidatus Pacebacteria bacterium]|nr:LemA family protein [Candidatus Paceibacterota bacterium]MBP9832203.1 LemA family protein [Candidatus Paceibacterota bacterium]
MKNSKLLIGAGVVVVALLLFVLASFNGLVQKDQAVTSAWAQVEADYQRRSDLVPNLVSTVKGAAAFETNTFLVVTEARAKATSIQIDPTKLTAENIAAYEQAQTGLSGALGKLLVIAENYPALTATESFRGLQTQLEGTENRIAVSRKDFNSAVQAYNVSTKTFPNSLVASLFGFVPKAYFEAVTGSENTPQVNF